MLGALAVAVHGQIPVERLRHMIYAHPTFHRAIEDALRDLDVMSKHAGFVCSVPSVAPRIG